MWTRRILTCPVFFMAVRSSPLRIPARRRCWLLPVLVLVVICNHLVTCAPTPVPDSTSTPTGEDPRKRSANVWGGDRYLKTESRVLEVLPNGRVSSSGEMEPKYGLMRVSTTIPNSEDINFAETSHPIGIGPNIDWYNNGHEVKQDIVITIKGVKSSYYVCMNRRGRVYGALNYTDECYFKQSLTHDGSFTLFYSYKYCGERPKRKTSQNCKNSKSKDSSEKLGKLWYLGLKVNGIMKGYKTDINNSNVQFLPKGEREIARDKYPNPSEMLTPSYPESPFMKTTQPQKSNRSRDTGSPFAGEPDPVRGGRKRKCNEVFVFPVLEGCRTKGKRRSRHRHGADSKRRGTRKHKKPRERHRRPRKKTPQLFQ